MADLLFRTEDIENNEILNLYVETDLDRSIINKLKATTPTIIVGSRGVGKSFLMKVAEQELSSSFGVDRVLPVYITFTKSSLINTKDKNQFLHWMLAKICSKTLRQLKKRGLLSNISESIDILSGGVYSEKYLKIEEVQQLYENSWREASSIDSSIIPDVDDFKDAIEEICDDFNIKRIVLLMDEAAHVFRPEQQRQFFTMFRDLRSSKITCNAAVYPGVTNYGNTFQFTQDATFVRLNRDVLDNQYLKQMREIVEKQIQADSSLLTSISRNGQNFAILAYAASGNPRFLLKTVSDAPKMTSTQINEVLRNFYKTGLFAEHTNLSSKYNAQVGFIDWGRTFIENTVLPDIQAKNYKYLQEDKQTTCFFWVHKDSPQSVKEALRLLEYTGIIQEHANSMKATRSEVGTRYLVNIGCLLALEATPASNGFEIAKNVTPKRMAEYGMNSPYYKDLMDKIPRFEEIDLSESLNRVLEQSINELDLSSWLIEGLKTIGISTLKDLLNAKESDIQKIYYVGTKRSRFVKNQAISAVYEFLNG